jgi:hypothetical protein
MTTPRPAYVAALRRHFTDLRDGTHGDAHDRAAKEALFATAVDLLDRYAREALAEVDTHLLRGTGDLTATGLHPTDDGGTAATWTLSWPEQRDAALDPITLHAFFGGGFHHPHLRGATVGDWPLNVFTEADAAAELVTFRTIAAADLHNLVFQRDFRIVPAIVR